ncbi:hypothetical protein ACFSSA_13940 [Luteolibacter algae]|uniref:ABC transporter permease n=1 Tax=Luteolibacter algae TaxID=454151 RepID=A0ABW5DB94_9BACT
MRLFKLTFTTIFRKKAWAICLFAVVALPFVLPMISSASEKPILVQPARIQAAWGTLLVCSMLWGFFSAARLGESNTRSGTGEYFRTTGVSGTRQLFEIWLALFAFILPLALITTGICLFAAMPADSGEKGMWWTLNLQYLALFLLVVAPLLALACALASRFGGISGFGITLFIALYGLYGVGYLDNMLKLEANAALQALWLYSPQYRFADLTQRLYFKTGALSSEVFANMVLYFSAILAVNVGISRLCFRTSANA